MSIAEYVFAIIGIVVIVGGFAYGIYDSYFQKRGSRKAGDSHENAKNEKSSTGWH